MWYFDVLDTNLIGNNEIKWYYCNYALYKNETTTIMKKKKYNFADLRLCNKLQVFQTLFFIGCLFHDVMKILNGPNWLNFGSKFQICLSYFFSSILLPLGIVSCTIGFIKLFIWTRYIYIILICMNLKIKKQKNHD